MSDYFIEQNENLIMTIANFLILSALTLRIKLEIVPAEYYAYEFQFRPTRKI